MVYTKEQYEEMIRRFNKAPFEKKMEILKQDPPIIGMDMDLMYTRFFFIGVSVEFEESLEETFVTWDEAEWCYSHNFHYLLAMAGIPVTNERL